MGKRGPKPGNPEEQQRRGNPGHRKPKDAETNTEPLTERPRVPTKIVADQAAAAEWRKASQELVDEGKLRPWLLKPLEMYCMAYSMAVKENHAKDLNAFKKAHSIMLDWWKVINASPVVNAKKEPGELEKFKERQKGIRVV